MAKKYIVELSQEEETSLVELTKKGRPSARKIKRANILLLAHTGKTDREIAALLHTGLRTVERTREKFVAGGPAFSLNEQARSGRLPKIDGKIETILTTLAQSQPPDGRVRWTLQLLADRLVTLTHLESLSYEAVRLVLKKRPQTLAAPKVVYSDCHRSSLCLAHGRPVGCVCRAFSKGVSRGLF